MKLKRDCYPLRMEHRIYLAVKKAAKKNDLQIRQYITSAIITKIESEE